MTTEREMLEFAANACGIFDRGEWFDTADGPVFVVGNKAFDPLTNSADCAAMCANLMIDSIWWSTHIECISPIGISKVTQHKEYGDDREAAWRYAATMVAAKIGGMK